MQYNALKFLFQYTLNHLLSLWKKNVRSYPLLTTTTSRKLLKRKCTTKKSRQEIAHHCCAYPAHTTDCNPTWMCENKSVQSLYSLRHWPTLGRKPPWPPSKLLSRPTTWAITSLGLSDAHYYCVTLTTFIHIIVFASTSKPDSQTDHVMWAVIFVSSGRYYLSPCCGVKSLIINHRNGLSKALFHPISNRCITVTVIFRTFTAMNLLPR